MTSKNEILLDSWLRLTTTIINPRVVYAMSYNESLVCNVLHRYQNQPDKLITATELCAETKILKSQMNRILNQLEENKMITRTRSTEDRRQVYISLNPENMTPYEEQHAKILSLLDNISARLGEEKTAQTIALFDEISDIAETLLS